MYDKLAGTEKVNKNEINSKDLSYLLHQKVVDSKT